MKSSSLRTLPAVLLVLAVALAGVPDAHAQLGIAAGANFDRLSDIEGDNDTGINFDNATGYHAGLFYELGAGPLRVRPGVYYMDVGAFDFQEEGIQEEVNEEFDLNLIEVPIDLRYQVFPFPLVKPYVTAGPVFRFNVSGDEGYNEAFKDFSFAGNVGGGLEIGLPGSSLRLYPELRYSFGVSSITEEFQIGNVEFNADDTRLNNFMLRLGVSF